MSKSPATVSYAPITTENIKLYFKQLLKEKMTNHTERKPGDAEKSRDQQPWYEFVTRLLPSVSGLFPALQSAIQSLDSDLKMTTTPKSNKLFIGNVFIPRVAQALKARAATPTAEDQSSEMKEGGSKEQRRKLDAVTAGPKKVKTSSNAPSSTRVPSFEVFKQVNNQLNNKRHKPGTTSGSLRAHLQDIREKNKKRLMEQYARVVLMSTSTLKPTTTKLDSVLQEIIAIARKHSQETQVNLIEPQKGRKIFKQNIAGKHAVIKDLMGTGVTESINKAPTTRIDFATVVRGGKGADFLIFNDPLAQCSKLANIHDKKKTLRDDVKVTKDKRKETTASSKVVSTGRMVSTTQQSTTSMDDFGHGPVTGSHRRRLESFKGPALCPGRLEPTFGFTVASSTTRKYDLSRTDSSCEAAYGNPIEKFQKLAERNLQSRWEDQLPGSQARNMLPKTSDFTYVVASGELGTTTLTSIKNNAETTTRVIAGKLAFPAYQLLGSLLSNSLVNVIPESAQNPVQPRVALLPLPHSVISGSAVAPRGVKGSSDRLTQGSRSIEMDTSLNRQNYNKYEVAGERSLLRPRSRPYWQRRYSGGLQERPYPGMEIDSRDFEERSADNSESLEVARNRYLPPFPRRTPSKLSRNRSGVYRWQRKSSGARLPASAFKRRASRYRIKQSLGRNLDINRGNLYKDHEGQITLRNMQEKRNSRGQFTMVYANGGSSVSPKTPMVSMESHKQDVFNEEVEEEMSDDTVMRSRRRRSKNGPVTHHTAVVPWAQALFRVWGDD